MIRWLIRRMGPRTTIMILFPSFKMHKEMLRQLSASTLVGSTCESRYCLPVKSLLLSLACLLPFPTALLAWGGDGHQIVAIIAEERLTPEAKATVHELLGADV